MQWVLFLLNPAKRRFILSKADLIQSYIVCIKKGGYTIYSCGFQTLQKSNFGGFDNTFDIF